MLNWYSCCSFCGSKFIKHEYNKFLCTECNKTTYINVSTAVGCYFYNSKKEILLVERKFDPRKWKFDEPWWFCDIWDISVEQALSREIEEELGISFDQTWLQYLGSQEVLYNYDMRDIPLMCILFYCFLQEEQIPLLQAKDDINNFIRVNKDTFNPDMMCSIEQAQQVYKVFNILEQTI